MSGGKPRKASRSGTTAPPYVVLEQPPRLSPSDRLAESQRERIASLESDKAKLNEAVTVLQAKVDSFGPEVARLSVSLKHAEDNNTFALIFTTAGGGILGYASYVGGPPNPWALVGFGILATGLIVMIASKIHK